MTYRRMILGSLLGVLVATQASALVTTVSIGAGSITRVPYTPPPPPLPQPPVPASVPIVTARTTNTISLHWYLQDTVTSSQLETSIGDENWSVLQTYGAGKSGDAFDYTDGGGISALPSGGFAVARMASTSRLVATTSVATTGVATSGLRLPRTLASDSLYCYRVRSFNVNGSSVSAEQCVYTKEYVTDSDGKPITRPVIRAQIVIHTAAVSGANTDDPVAVILGDSVTWLDYPQDDFELDHTDAYDLKLDSISEIGDIESLTIWKTGSNAWCIAGLDLLVNDQGASEDGYILYSHDFGNEPGGCHWLNDGAIGSDSFTVTHQQLRAYPGWYSFNPAIVPVIPASELKSQVEMFLGDAFHGTAAYWGDNGSVNLTPHPDQNTIHVDSHFKVEVTGPNPDVDLSFDLVVSGGCQPDGTLNLSIDPENVHTDASLGIVGSLEGFFACTADLSRPTCIQVGTEDAIRKAFHAPSTGFSAYAGGLCNVPYQWVIYPNGDINLGL
jgi:hypothetical protein